MIRFIAEIGLNHLGDEKRAQRTVDAMLASPVEAITFQIREKSFYNGQDQARKRLSESFYQQAIKKVHTQGKQFGIATCDLKIIPFFNTAGIDFWKTLSWDLVNTELQKELQKTAKTVYISTGVSGIDDIVDASRQYSNIIFIHTQLSQKLEEVNLKAIEGIRKKTGKQVAFGLHCDNFDVLKLSLPYEPEAIFFYVKERNCTGLFDDEHALFVDEVERKISELKLLAQSLGTGEKVAMQKPSWVVK